ncbi:hypothetical protein BV98_000195 [Sphingobium herbicidovorans NBRC 16415]|uniref:Uncharacterized protein n=1 Tax=Sphingobium herbicidovorans (strain ATCC 700291 / DSM 11019 / CCUG 56400 / KCTC 2939 / LMG 18315 / NBRC 16415 / MH) TaxID=1219045 RepID=A0A086PEX6_SPHHM|nr:hypothetical protein BV98_000195 [Sphingobium herbicidovorans NBRC 16415]
MLSLHWATIADFGGGVQTGEAWLVFALEEIELGMA